MLSALPALACTPHSTTFSSRDTMIRSSRAIARREWKARPGFCKGIIAAEIAQASRHPRSIRSGRPSAPSDGDARTGIDMAQDRRPPACAATVPTDRGACRARGSSRCRVRTSAITAPRGSNEGKWRGSPRRRCTCADLRTRMTLPCHPMLSEREVRSRPGFQSPCSSSRWYAAGRRPSHRTVDLLPAER